MRQFRKIKNRLNVPKNVHKKMYNNLENKQKRGLL